MRGSARSSRGGSSGSSSSSSTSSSSRRRIGSGGGGRCSGGASCDTPSVTPSTPDGQGLLRGVYGFVKAEGVSGIYRGLFATVCKSASNQALRFVIFGEYKRVMWGSRPAHEMPPWVALGGGMVAGALGSVITMPFDVLKTKMQGLSANRRTHSTAQHSAQHVHGTCVVYAW